MDKKTGIIIGVIIAAFLVVLGAAIWRNNLSGGQNEHTDYSTYARSEIVNLAARIDYKALNLNSILPAADYNGNLPENVIGDRKAPVVIYEYADYQCGYCAAMAPYINEVVQGYNGQVAVVFRNYILPYHSNSTRVASAAEAAAIQGHWNKYKDLVFANQNEWANSSDSNLQEYLEKYFIQIAGDQADLSQFRTDMASAAVAQKLAFDFGAGNTMDIGGTPWFYLDGAWIDGTNMTPAQLAEKIRSAIDEKLAAE